MTINIPSSISEKKQTSRQKINEDEFEAILAIVKDEDIGIEGGSIEETQELAALKESAVHKVQITSNNDQQDILFDKSRDRVLGGNEQYKTSSYILKQGEDLRDAAYKIYGDANAWVILAAANNITAPSSQKEVYPGKELIII